MAIEWRTIGFPHHLMRVEAGSMRLANIQLTSGSQLSNFVRATGLIDRRWTGRFDMSQMEQEQWQEWDSFIARLSGQAVLFEVHSPAQVLPLGEAGGFPGAAYSITGTTISGVSILQGATSAIVLANQSRNRSAILIDFGDAMAGAVVLKHGDRFGLRGNLYMVTGPVTADANGHARVSFAPRLRRAAFVGDVVNFLRPSCRVMLASGNEGQTELSAPSFGKSSLSFIEVPYT